MLGRQLTASLNRRHLNPKVYCGWVSTMSLEVSRSPIFAARVWRSSRQFQRLCSEDEISGTTNDNIEVTLTWPPAVGDSRRTSRCGVSRNSTSWGFIRASASELDRAAATCRVLGHTSHG